MESLTLLCKVCSGVTLSDRISLNYCCTYSVCIGLAVVQVVLKSIDREVSEI